MLVHEITFAGRKSSHLAENQTKTVYYWNRNHDREWPSQHILREIEITCLWSFIPAVSVGPLQNVDLPTHLFPAWANEFMVWESESGESLQTFGWATAKGSLPINGSYYLAVALTLPNTEPLAGESYLSMVERTWRVKDWLFGENRDLLNALLVELPCNNAEHLGQTGQAFHENTYRTPYGFGFEYWYTPPKLGGGKQPLYKIIYEDHTRYIWVGNHHYKLRGHPGLPLPGQQRRLDLVVSLLQGNRSPKEGEDYEL